MSDKQTVLIVDDEPVIRQVLRRTVIREGYAVTEAGDGIEALERLADAHFDVVITDIKMPRMDGIKLLEEIRTRFKETSVIFITGYAGEYTAEHALHAGADYFITKPFKNTEIAQTLRDLRLKHGR